MYFLAKHICKATICALGILAISSAHATTVQIQTTLGNIDVNLYDKTTPETVANFLAYVNSGAYTNTIVHRSAKKNDGQDAFVIQSGGYLYPGALPLSTVEPRLDLDDKDSDGNISEVLNPTNEPKFSNVRGTLAMAKLDNDASSATSQWFINLNDNSVDIDASNGGFTVFGQVSAEGMAVADAIAALERFNMGDALGSIPLQNYTLEDAANNTLVTGSHLVLINAIQVLDPSPDTADSLTPTPNTRVSNAKDDDSSGSIGILVLVLLGALSIARGLTRANTSSLRKTL